MEISIEKVKSVYITMLIYTILSIIMNFQQTVELVGQTLPGMPEQGHPVTKPLTRAASEIPIKVDPSETRDGRKLMARDRRTDR